MGRQSKESLLREFSQEPYTNNFDSVADMEYNFANWYRVNGKSMYTRDGQDYLDHSFTGRVKYSSEILERNPDLMRSFGLSQSDIEWGKSKNNCCGVVSDDYASDDYDEYDSDDYDDAPYYKKSHKYNSNDDFDFFDFLPDFLGRIPKWLWIFAIVVVIFTVFGDASFSIDNWFSWGSFSLGNIFGGFFSDVYAFFTGGFKKIISILIAGIISVGLLKADINCPLFVRILILFVIWIGVLNYDW